MERAKKEFLKAYEDYADTLFRYCYFRVSDREAAKDLLQTVFCQTWAYLVAGGRIRHLKPFLYKTARNLVINHYRRPAASSLEQLQETGFDQEEAKRLSLPDQLEGERIIAWFAELPERYREVLFMRYVEDLTVKEIAEIVGETENAVSVRLHRGLARLKEIFNK